MSRWVAGPLTVSLTGPTYDAGVPYKLRGNSVVRADTGKVVKSHPTRARALAHLRALKANVEESAGVVGVLLEGFDASAHPRGFHGRWVRGHGGKPGRIEGTYNGVKLERGVAYQGRLATGEIHTGMWTGKVTGRGVDDPNAHPEFRHVDTGAVRTFHGGEFFGKLSGVKPAVPRSLPTSRRATLGRAEGDAAARTRAEILAKSPGAAADLARHQSIARGAREATPPSVTHAKVRGYLENLPQGRYFHLGGLDSGGALARRTSAGFEVYRAQQAKPDKVHKTPSAAAAHMIRIRNGRVVESAPTVLGALLEGA